MMVVNECGVILFHFCIPGTFGYITSFEYKLINVSQIQLYQRVLVRTVGFLENYAVGDPW